MSDHDGSQDSEQGPLPQEVIEMLFNEEDFKQKVAADQENLCCVVITSTLCSYSGIGKLRYPPPPKPEGQSGEDEAVDDAEEEGHEEEEEEVNRGHSLFSQFKEQLVENPDTTFHRRHVRFFHICACSEEETNVAPLIASDPTFTVAKRQPNEQEKVILHKRAYEQLVALLHSLEVRSTPQMRFFVKGLPLRYSLLLEHAEGENKKILEKATLDTATDPIRATGSNLNKWKNVFFNAVVVRNGLLREHDLEVKERAKQARKEQRRLERQERRRQEVEAAGDEEDDDE